jgi:hypothetical protein
LRGPHQFREAGTPSASTSGRSSDARRPPPRCQTRPRCRAALRRRQARPERRPAGEPVPPPRPVGAPDLPSSLHLTGQVSEPGDPRSIVIIDLHPSEIPEQLYDQVARDRGLVDTVDRWSGVVGGQAGLSDSSQDDSPTRSVDLLPWLEHPAPTLSTSAYIDRCIGSGSPRSL